MGVPFIFITGNPALLPAEHSGRPFLAKPWTTATLLSLIPQVLDAKGHPNAIRDSAGTRMYQLGLPRGGFAAIVWGV